MTRRSMALFLAMAMLAGCSATGAGGSSGSGLGDTIEGPTGGGSAPSGETVRVVTVFDGDSLLVGTGNGEREVRLAGVNSPEQDECFGAEARQWMTEAAGSEVTLVTVGGEDDTDQFDRLLRDVWAGGRWLNREAVAGGYAMVIHTGRDRQDELLETGGGAWEQRVGMWSDVCGPGADGVAITDLVWDPPGPDDEVAEGEHVVIENLGDDPVAIGGWVLRDESTLNRFQFADGDMLEPGASIMIYSGCGEAGREERFWCANDPVWSNGGDTALLQSADGTVVDRVVYP